MDLKALIELSRKYGSDPDFVLAGGGNTSFKEGNTMAVKASGNALSTISEDGFVLMDTEKLRALTKAEYPGGDKEREACALRDMMAARLPGEGEKRPSVECILHALFGKRYVLHVHPAVVNGLTCGQDGEAVARDLFEDSKESFLWIPLTKPGFTLSKKCAEMFEAHNKEHGEYPSILLIQNHGIFVAADSPEETDSLMMDAVSRISKRIVRQPDLGSAVVLPEGVADAAMQIESRYSVEVGFLYNKEIARLVADREAYAPMLKPFSPDHIVYCRAYPLFLDSMDSLEKGFHEYDLAYGGTPKIVAVRGLGVFALGKDAADSETASMLFMDALKIAIYSESFGGPLALPDEFTDFIVNWEVESYRQKKLS